MSEVRVGGRGRWRAVAFAGVSLMVIFKASGGSAPPSPESTSQRPLDIGDAVVNTQSKRPTPADGGAVYSDNCLVCHGGAGDGRGPLSHNQPVPPRDFTDASWMASHADGTFFTSILRGVPGSSMPAFAGRLTETQIWAAVLYIRGFAAPVLRDEVQNRDGKNAGAALYMEKCEGCHGDHGRGDGEGMALFDRAPRDLSNRDWMASRSDDRLRNIVRYGVAGSPMPGFIDELTEDQLTVLIAFLRSLSGTQPGKNPVKGHGAVLYGELCAACHGHSGDGHGPGSDQLWPRPRDLRDPTWLTAQTDARLATAITYGRPGTNMPPFGALLTAAETTELVAYVRGFARAVPGAEASATTAPDVLPGAVACFAVLPTRDP